MRKWSVFSWRGWFYDKHLWRRYWTSSFDKGRKSLARWVLNFKGRFYTMVFVAWLDEFKLKLNKAILASAFKVQTHEIGFVGGGRLWALLDPWPRNNFTSSFPSSDFKWMFLFPGANELQPPALSVAQPNSTATSYGHWTHPPSLTILATPNLPEQLVCRTFSYWIALSRLDGIWTVRLND